MEKDQINNLRREEAENLGQSNIIRDEDKSIPELQNELKDDEKIKSAEVVVIAEERIKNILEEALKDLRFDGRVAVVSAEYIEGGQMRSQANGLKIAEQLADDYDQVIILGMLTSAMYADKPSWHAAMAHENVFFTSIISSLSELRDYIESEKGKRPSDPLGLEVKNFAENQQLMRTLVHDYPHAVRNNTLDQWELKARKIFGDDISLEEMIEKLGEQKENGIGKLEGRAFPDLCVDIEGTLIQDGAINNELLKKMKDESKVRPITIWSGGDLDSYSKILRRAGIDYKIISKYWMRGTKVAMAIDDLPKAEFESTYGIEVEEYVQIQ